jgi:GNAT superfamily N-acetyltransferase
MIAIKQTQNKKDLTKFIDFPHDLYNGDENYVPELFIAQEDLLSKKHPFFHHSEADYFLAYMDNKIVGRIAAIKNNNYIDYTGDQAGSFGFFDVIQDYELAKALFDRVVEWLKERGLTKILGPHNFSTNETCGVLIEGFDSPPTVMMPYNKPYYSEFLDRYGFEKEMDLLSYKILTKDVPQKLLNMVPKILERFNSKGITIRKPNMKRFDQEVNTIIKIYNAAWEKNWGFVPMTDEEFKHAAKDMKRILDPDFLLIAEHQGQPIGFSLSIPDMNVPLKHLKNGRLLPFGIFKLLHYKKNIDRVRVVTLGIVEGYRKMGIDAYFYAKAFEEAKKKKMLFGEASWILENNEIMNKALKNINGHVYKKHRLYKKFI